MDSFPNNSHDHMAAIQAFALKHGRTWKAKLADAWGMGTDNHEPMGWALRDIRNSPHGGHAWLDAYQFDWARAYVEAKAKGETIEQAERAASMALSAVPGVGTGNMGLTPDSVKFSPAYREAKAAHSGAFRTLKEHNKAMTRNFSKEMRAERAKRYATT